MLTDIIGLYYVNRIMKDFCFACLRREENECFFKKLGEPERRKEGANWGKKGKGQVKEHV